MKISLEKFFQNYNKFDFEGKAVQFEFSSVQGQDVVHGIVRKLHSKGNFPNYDVYKDCWYSFKEGDDYGELELYLNVHEDGETTFAYLGDPDTIAKFHFVSPNELNDLLNILPQSNESVLNQPLSFMEFKFEQVFSDLYFSISLDDEIKFVPLNELKRALPDELFKDAINTLFSEDYNFLVDIGSWWHFCKERKLAELPGLVSFEKIPILYFKGVLSNCSPAIDTYTPYLGFGIRKDFSAQYLYDYFTNSADGIEFLKSFKIALLTNQPIKKLTLIAPKDFISQIKYSTAFRHQYDYYKYELTKAGNHITTSVRDIKDLYKNRRQMANEFLLNSENFKFLDTLKKPLPFNIEKNFRSYLRAAKDMDQYFYGGKLYNLILRSIVFYPLEEMIRLGFDKSNGEIAEIIEITRSEKPMSDGSWLSLFNRLASILGRNKEIELCYFGKLVMNIQGNIYSILDKMFIPARNDAAHYREHAGIFMALLNRYIPDILDIFRNSLQDSLFLLIQDQKQKEDGLYIKAKKIMGYEVDIETIEFKTKLSGDQFISDYLIAYNSQYDYTVPLVNYFIVELSTSESIKMGIMDKVQNGNVVFDY